MILLDPLLALCFTAASSTAVLSVGPVDASGEARALRQRLVEQGHAVIPEATLRDKLTLLAPSPRAVTLDEAKTRATAAEDLRMEGELAASATELDGIIAALEQGATSPQETAFIERLRIEAAVTWLGSAGPEESGKAESEVGQRALRHLDAALRKNPTLALDVARYPPKMRRLLEMARINLQKTGLADLEVTSRPSGATVLVDGRPLGKTPLALTAALPRGPHRVWVEKDGKRSAVRDLDLGEGANRVDIDVAMEASALPAGPALLWPTDETFDEARAGALAALLDADELILVGRTEASTVLASVHYRRGTGSVTRTAIGDAASEGAIEALATRLADLTPSDGSSTYVPAWLLPPAAPPTSELAAAAATDGEEESEGGGLWWVAGGLGAGAAGVLVVGGVAAAVGGTLFVLSQQQTPPEPTGVFAVTVEP